MAILVGPGVNIDSARFIYTALLNKGAVPRFVGSRLGAVRSANGDAINVDISIEAGPSVLYDGMVIPDGDQAIIALLRDAGDARADQPRQAR